MLGHATTNNNSVPVSPTPCAATTRTPTKEPDEGFSAVVPTDDVTQEDAVDDSLHTETQDVDETSRPSPARDELPDEAPEEIKAFKAAAATLESLNESRTVDDPSPEERPREGSRRAPNDDDDIACPLTQTYSDEDEKKQPSGVSSQATETVARLPNAPCLPRPEDEDLPVVAARDDDDEYDESDCDGSVALAQTVIRAGNVEFDAMALAAALKRRATADGRLGIARFLRSSFPSFNGIVCGRLEDTLDDEVESVGDESLPTWIITRLETRARQRCCRAVLASCDKPPLIAINFTFIENKCYTIPVIGGPFVFEHTAHHRWGASEPMPSKARFVALDSNSPDENDSAKVAPVDALSENNQFCHPEQPARVQTTAAAVASVESNLTSKSPIDSSPPCEEEMPVSSVFETPKDVVSHDETLFESDDESSKRRPWFKLRQKSADGIKRRPASKRRLFESPEHQENAANKQHTQTSSSSSSSSKRRRRRRCIITSSPVHENHMTPPESSEDPVERTFVVVERCARVLRDASFVLLKHARKMGCAAVASDCEEVATHVLAALKSLLGADAYDDDLVAFQKALRQRTLPALSESSALRKDVKKLLSRRNLSALLDDESLTPGGGCFEEPGGDRSSQEAEVDFDAAQSRDLVKQKKRKSYSQKRRRQHTREARRDHATDAEAVETAWRDLKRQGWTDLWDYVILGNRHSGKDEYAYCKPGVTKETAIVNYNVFLSKQEAVRHCQTWKPLTKDDILAQAQNFDPDFAAKAHDLGDDLDALNLEFARLVQHQRDLERRLYLETEERHTRSRRRRTS